MRKSIVPYFVCLLFVGWVGIRLTQAASFSQLFSFLRSDVYDFQALIAGVIALIAAWIAARPVYEQLRSSKAQNEILSREILFGRIGRLEKEAAAVRNDILAFFQNYRNPYIDQTSSTLDLSDLNSHAAFDAEQSLQQIISRLESQQEKREDGESVQAARAEFIEHAKRLADCFDDIHSPDSRSGDPEISEQDEARMDERATIASQEAVGLICDLDDKSNLVQRAYEKEIELSRNRIRRIDDLLLTEN